VKKIRLDRDVTATQVAEFEDLRRRTLGHQEWERLPHQTPPDGDWFGWILEAGRGSGKSFAANMATRDHLNGPACISRAVPHRAAIIAPTIGDAVETAETDDGALVRMEPGAQVRTARGGTILHWPNQSQVRLFGVHTKDDVERLRAGGNRCWVHVEEFAAWRYLQDAWDQMMFGLRLGPRPRWVMTTTPKARPDYLSIVEELEARDDVVVTNASTDDNPHLSEQQKQYLYERFDATSLGGQELHGKRVQQAEGALWTYDLIEANRVKSSYDDNGDTVTGRVVVAIDPPGGATECGIVTAATIPHNCPCESDAANPHYVVLADDSAKLTPRGWAHRAIAAYEQWGADRLVAEKNFGGDMVESTIRTVDKSISYESVTASRGKRIRAEPVKSLYEQGRVHHVGTFPELEAEMVQWMPDESAWSPNRLDALVWAITELGDVGEPALWFV
jgi:phage terminase large subunit-like protein